MLSTRANHGILLFLMLSRFILGAHAFVRKRKRRLQDYGRTYYSFDMSLNETEAAADGMLDKDGGLKTDVAICVETSIASNADRLTREYAKDIKNFHEMRRWWKVAKVSYNWKDLRYIALVVKSVYVGIVEVFVRDVLVSTTKVRLRGKERQADANNSNVGMNGRNSNRRRAQRGSAQVVTKKKKRPRKKKGRNRRKWDRFRIKAHCQLCKPDDLDAGRRLLQDDDVDYATWMNEKLKEQVSGDCPGIGKHVTSTRLFECDCTGEPLIKGRGRKLCEIESYMAANDVDLGH